MKILVTGSSGTIGTRLCERLLERGDTVAGVDRRRNEWNATVDAITIVADLLDEKALQKLSTDFDIVIHLAANARVYDLVKDPTRAFENMQTTYNILEWVRKNTVPRVLFASSRECYGNSDAEKYTEDMASIERCESPYTASKIAGEAMVNAYWRCYDIKGAIVRFSNVYGAYDTSDRVVPLFFRQSRKNETLTIFGKTKSLDFTYIDDTVSGIILMIDHFDEIQGETINIASGSKTSLVECAKQIKTLVGSSSAIVIGEPRTGEVTSYTADLTKAKRLLGYAPIYSFDEGLKKAIDWYKANT